MNEQIKKLFTPTEKELPKEKGWYCCYDGRYKDRYYMGYFNGNRFHQPNKGTTHWLDLSTLCKKEAAIELARDAWKEGFEYSYNEHFGKIPNPSLKETDFIDKNQHKL